MGKAYKQAYLEVVKELEQIRNILKIVLEAPHCIVVKGEESPSSFLK